jgi:acyl transferase domain-containing protein/acyl-CoA synthetase (AMP-forming)/AMP-acid ligase II/acyl carrier protein
MTASAANSPLTLPHVVLQHALANPTRPALTFLVDGEHSTICLSYLELVTRASAIAAELKRRDLAGHPIVLLYPAGPEYLCALLGCFWAGAIAVPAYPPSARSLSRASERVASLVANAGASFALTNSACEPSLNALAAPELTRLTTLVTDSWRGQPAGFVPPALNATDWEPIEVDPDQPCLLQYTSGSTSEPKGVLLTHAQMCANLAIIYAASGPRIDGPIVTWLPPYHDMGLIGTLLFALHRGNGIVQLAPEAFVRRPLRWLQAISDHRATATATPNFALDLCLRRIPPAQRAGLDLSSMQFMFNGSEPIDAASLEAFAEAFAPFGLRREALVPSYGMAEATLLLASTGGSAAPRSQRFAADALEKGEAIAAGSGERDRTLVSCGRAYPAGALRIVDPQRCIELGARQVGEIWAQSPSVASGYWRRPEETRATFHARLADSAEGPFLRTGDLGFLDDGELFVTGRIKDSIIVRGKKHFPQDIERSVQRLDAALIADAGAAFSIQLEHGEQVCVVQELDHRLQPDAAALLEKIASAILDQHQLAVHAVVLVKRGTLLKTSSGKIRRRAMREAFLADDLAVVARWQTAAARATEFQTATAEATAMQPTAANDSPATRLTSREPQPEERQTRTRLVTGERRCQAIERFLRDRVAQLAKLPAEAIDTDTPLAQYGLDSLAATELAEALEAWLGEPVAATISYDHPTIRGIARALAGLTADARAESAAISGEDRRESEPFEPRQPAQPNGAAAAIIGMACRFPGADDLSAFWTLLQSGGDAVGEVPKTRWDPAGLAEALAGRAASSAGRFGGFVSGIEDFDAEFFGISAREATRMDPQQRLFLELVWHALEDAGIAPESLAGSDTGVFAAVCGSDHALVHGADLSRVDADFGTGHSGSVVANRVSYFLDLRGPSLAFDSACASSLVALQAARQSLASGEIQLAIVGGVNAVLAPHAGLFFASARALANDGRCKTFDKSADGFVRSEGCGVIILQALPHARAQHSRVYALVSGSAVAHNGASNGLMAPSGAAQERVIRSALSRAALTPDALDYIEAHGVGARLADTVELRALGSLLKTGSRKTPCWVGSVKTNIGHLEAASGMASVIKTALALAHEEIPRHLHVTELHPEIAQQALPIRVPLQSVPWRRSERPRHAGVSTFGFGGSNAHVILSEAPRRSALPGNSPEHERPSQLLALSARNGRALTELALRWADALPGLPLADACFSGNAGRKHFAERAAFVASSTPQLCAALRTFARGHASDERTRPRLNPRVVIAFADHVPPPGRGQALYAREPEFRRAFDRACAWLEPELGMPLAKRWFTADARTTAWTGPLACAVASAFQYALWMLLRAWGIDGEVVCGSGTAEYLAACAAGVLEWSDGLCLALQHAQLTASLVPGAEIVRSVRGLQRTLARAPLSAAQRLLRLASRPEPLARGARLEPEHFRQQIYQADDRSSAAHSEPGDLRVLLGDAQLAVRCELLGQTPPAAGTDDYGALLPSIATLYERGVDVDWQAFERPFQRERLSVPGYPFQRKRCWLEPPRSAPQPTSLPALGRSAHPLLRRMTGAPAAQGGGAWPGGEPTKNTG